MQESLREQVIDAPPSGRPWSGGGTVNAHSGYRGSIEETLYHVDSCKIEYCKQGFARWTGDYLKPFGDVSVMVALARISHERRLRCLESCLC